MGCMWTAAAGQRSTSMGGCRSGLTFLPASCPGQGKRRKRYRWARDVGIVIRSVHNNRLPTMMQMHHTPALRLRARGKGKPMRMIYRGVST